ncbi:MAG TPA: calcium-binding protein, partial [Lapillicoccus sp.]|nr:calcium-binding protein [Lapillicoccus sp.]
SGLDIAFEDLSINAGDFLGEVLKPIVEEIQRVTGPVQPIIDTLYAPIPVLSDLSKLAGGGDVTIVSLAKTFSTLADGPDLDFVDTIAAVITFVNKLPKPKAGEDLLIPIGSFEVSSQKAFDTPATPDTAASLIDAASKTYKKRTGPGTFTDTTDPGEVDLAGSIDAVSDKPSLGGSGSVAKGAGFAFPVLDNPGSLFNLVMGADVDLVTFDSGPLTLGFTWRQSFGPVYAPPPVFITLSGSASVTAQIQAGFDTYGLRKAFESGFDSAGSVAQILNGLYFKSADEQGNPIPVVTFYGEIAAGAAVSAVVITVGVEGGVSLTINLAWNDPNNDGKFRLFEFGAVALRNPLCLFQMSGRIGIFLRVYITLGISPFSVSFSFTLADITLLDFNVKPNCTPPPPRLAGLTEDGETLVVFAGKFGKGERGDSAWSNNGSDDDTLQVQALHDLTQQTKPVTGAKVTMLGITETFASTALKRVVVDGSSDYTGKLKVTFIGDGEKDTDETTTGAAKTGQFDLDAIVLGGSNDDTVRTGTKSSYVDGGGGKDVVTTDDQPGAGITVKVAGGGDADSIKVGDAGGTVAGDSALARSAKAAFDVKAANGSTVKITGIVDWTSIGNPGDGENGSDGNDRIAVGLGQNTVYGNGKDDAVGVAADSDLAKLPGATPSDVTRWTAKPNTVVLGSGSDSLQGGSSTDTVWTGLRTAADRGVLDGAHGVDEPGADDTGATRNTVNTGAGSDTVFGSKAVDFVTGGSTTSQSDHFRGGDGDDVLIGGLGTDNLFGGPGRDWVVAEPGQVSESQGTDAFGIARTYAHSALPAGTTPSGKLLVGGDGADRVVGGDGASTLFGDRYETDACGTPVQTPESTAPAEPAAGSPGRDLVLGGAGVDKVKAGGDADLVRAFASDDLLCGQDGADEIYAGDGADTTWAGSGADKAYGEAGDDEVYGNDGEDQLYGGDQADVVEGNDGADRAFGGAQDDFVVGGTRAAGARDKGVDQLFGEAGKDVVVGDNARDTAPRYPLDLTGSDPDAGDQDVASGGADDDKVFGGLYGDTVSGNDGVDALEGNNGGDTVLGGAGSDDIIGGSSEVPSAGIGYPDGQDLLRGESGDDVAAGDNARIQRVTTGSGDAVTRGRGLTAERTVTLHDLGHADVAARYGDDDIAGGSAADVLFGQGGGDLVHGDAGSDYAEGGQGSDDVFGDGDEDDLVGGGSVPYDGTGQTTRGQLDTGDRIRGGTEGDVVLGDNGLVTRGGTPHPVTADRGIATRTIQPYDLAAAAALPAVRAGNDVLLGEDGVDVVFGQAGLDRALAGAASDYAEGGPDADWLEGGDGSDDLVGGSSTKDGTGSGTATAGQPDAGDVVWGQAGDDLQTGDNALVTRSGRDALTDRVSTPGTKIEQRTLQLYDLAVNGPLADPAAARFGADHLSGQEGVDVQLGQDGADRISGGGDDDYAEGQGGADLVWGDDPLQGVPGPGSWPGSASAAYDSDGAIDGQDDLLGGWSFKGYRDAGDQVRGNGAADFLLGDNGSVRRDITASTDDRRYAKRYAAGTLPTDAVKVRISGSGQPSTRFCTTVQAVCEAAEASGSDQLFGDAGDDTAYGQDGDDVVRGGADGDDLYGELGDDRVLGEDGDDAIVGDRGGIVDQYEDGTRAVTVTLNAPPAVSYTARTKGSLTRLVDLRHDVNGDAFVGNGTDPAMPYDGVDFSDKDLADGNDYLRGGAGDDSLHGGHGDDLANGDSGGDTVFGGDGADVLWGGKGCDVQTDELVADCRTDGAFDPSARGSGDRKVDYVFGGKGAVEGPSLADGGYGLDILDWRPRGTAASCTSGLWPVTVGLQTTDPCGWFEATNLDNSDAADNQHHQGVDWQYGGWDRDVMQGDVAANGPNDGDRMMDWNGAYNLYTHCNAAYGGFNDVRLHSPALQDFLQRWAYAEGAGQVLSDVTAAGTSAYNELALVYNPDNKHASGPAFSSTPGHFDDPYACSAE